VALKDLQKTIENISSISTLPTVIERITRLLQNPKTSAEEIGRAITTDQALASKVLKLVNSAFYGFPGRISTITHAIVILGFSTVKNIVLTASILDVFRRKGTSDLADFDFEQFWMHSIACGAASQSIAKFLGNKDKEECFIGGLIHDIGKVILCQFLPADFIDAYSMSKKEGILFYESEKKLFNITHEEIGGMLAERWNLPKSLQNAIKYHHCPLPSRDYYMNTAVVHCADIFVRSLDYGNGGDDKIPAMAENVWKNLGLENTSLTTLFDNIEDEIEKANVFIQLT
jgi:putative nucleotidyltransferase with HDIG domain